MPRRAQSRSFNTVVVAKTFPNGGLPRVGLAGPWPGRGSAPGNGAHLGSPRVLHDLVVVIGHVAHRRVRRVRRVRGCVCPRGFRGKFLTDCVTVGSKPDAEKKESRVGRKDAGPACSTFLPDCEATQNGRVSPFTKKISSSILTRSSRFPLGPIGTSPRKSAFFVP